MKGDNDFISIVKGALLHDIGKVVQRAHTDPTAKTHMEWGYGWLKEHLGEETVAIAALAHHYTRDDDYAFNSNTGLIWYQSDNLASKERKGKEKLEESKWHSEIALASPFSRIRNPNNLSEKPPLTFLPLRESKAIPEVLEEEPVITRKDYEAILKAFESDLKKADNRPHSIEFLLMLLEKHLSRVPSITMRIYSGLSREEVKDKHPDISMYDHSKLTAAIAGCMCHYYRETYPEKWDNNQLLKEEILNIPEDTKPYLLIGGDISGVQRFIYTITSKGALKSLKGRSFFLELLAEHIISELLTRLNLTRCNLLFAGGGHFYILSYHTSFSIYTLKEVKKEIDNHLFKEFAGTLQLHLESVPFHPEGFKDASGIWTELSRRLERSKKQKWQGRMDELLRPQMPHEDCLTQSCEVCFREDISLIELDIGEDVLKVCDPCLKQYQLGKMLISISKRDYPVLYKFDTEPVDNYIEINRSYYQLKKKEDSEAHKSAVAVYRINDFEARNYSHPKSIHLPIGIYQHEEFNELTDVSSIFGVKRIGVLRMDVDNLGRIFSQAVPEEDRTFSRMASISRWLNNFFKYYLNDVVEGKTLDEVSEVVKERDVREKGRRVSIVYSGGDDVFLIGHWLDVTEGAFDIERCFKRYTGNPFITISGGIALDHEKHPVYQYAREAGEAEDLAKVCKDSITLFGKDFKWTEALRIVERVKLFCRFLTFKDTHLVTDEEKLPTTFFYRLLSLARRFNEEGVLVLPKAAYLMSRARLKDSKEDNMRIKDIVMNTNKNEWKVTEAAALWVLMLMRKGGEER